MPMSALVLPISGVRADSLRHAVVITPGKPLMTKCGVPADATRLGHAPITCSKCH
jgi:hypothetical protein